MGINVEKMQRKNEKYGNETDGAETLDKRKVDFLSSGVRHFLP